MKTSIITMMIIFGLSGCVEPCKPVSSFDKDSLLPRNIAINYNIIIGTSVRDSEIKSLQNAYLDGYRQISDLNGIDIYTQFTKNEICEKKDSSENCMKKVEKVLQTTSSITIPKVERVNQKTICLGSGENKFTSFVVLKFPKDIDEIEPVFTKQQTVAIAIHRNKAISKDKAKKSLYRKVFLCGKYENLSDIEFRTFKALNKRKELVFKTYAFTSFKKQNMSENFIRYSNLPTLELQNICCNQKNISKNTKLLLRKGKSYITDEVKKILTNQSSIRELSKTYQDIEQELNQMENLFIRVARDKTFENAKWIDFLDNSIDPLIENINNAKFSGSVKKNIEEFDKYIDSIKTVDNRTFFVEKLDNFETLKICSQEYITHFPKIQYRQASIKTLQNHIEMIDNLASTTKNYLRNISKLLKALLDGKNNLNNYLNSYSAILSGTSDLSLSMEKFKKNSDYLRFFEKAKYYQNQIREILILELINTKDMPEMTIYNILERFQTKLEKVINLSMAINLARGLSFWTNSRLILLQDFQEKSLKKNDILIFKELEIDERNKNIIFVFTGECGEEKTFKFTFLDLKPQIFKMQKQGQSPNPDPDISSILSSSDFRKLQVAENKEIYFGEAESELKTGSIQLALNNIYKNIISMNRLNINMQDSYNQAKMICSMQIQNSEFIDDIAVVQNAHLEKVETYRASENGKTIYKSYVAISYIKPMSIIENNNSTDENISYIPTSPVSGYQFSATSSISYDDAQANAEQLTKETIFVRNSVESRFLKDILDKIFFFDIEERTEGTDRNSNLIYKVTVNIHNVKEFVRKFKEIKIRFNKFQFLPKNLRDACFEKKKSKIRELGADEVKKIKSIFQIAFKYPKIENLESALEQNNTIISLENCRIPNYLKNDLDKIEFLKDYLFDNKIIISIKKDFSVRTTYTNDFGRVIDKQLPFQNSKYYLINSYENDILTISNPYHRQFKIKLSELVKNYKRFQLKSKGE